MAFTGFFLVTYDMQNRQREEHVAVSSCTFQAALIDVMELK